MEQKNTLLFLFLLILLSFVSYLVPSTFYPEVALEKGCGLGVIGGIISLFPIGGGLTSQYLGKSMNTLGRKRVIMLGGKLLSFSFLLFSLSIYIDSKYIFIIVGVVARFLQGCAVSMITTVAYGLIPILFPTRVGECVAYFELAIGLGQAVGANAAYAIKTLLKSNFALFLSFCIFYFFYTIPLVKPIPPDTNDEAPKNQNLSYMEFLANSKFLWTNLALLVTLTGNLFLLCGIVFGIKDYPHLENHMVSLIGCYTVVYGLGMYALSQVDGKFLYNNLMIWGFVVQILFFCFAGVYPEWLLPNDITSLYIGFTMTAIGNAMVFQPCMAQMIEVGIEMKQLDPEEKDYEAQKNSITDLCSGCFIIFISIGEFIGPILSTQLMSYFSWSFSCFVMQLLIVIVMVFYCKTWGYGPQKERLLSYAKV